MSRITCVVENSVQRSSPFWGEHGLAWWIQAGQAAVMFDTGGTETVLQHNLTRLDKYLDQVDALALSHGHLDHTGGLDAFLWREAKLPLYANPDLFRPRFSLKEGQYRPIGLRHSREALARVFEFHLQGTPAEIVPGLWTTGEITERPERTGSSARHFVPAGDGWTPDPYRDDMSLVLKTGRGLVVICGCCHAGLLNTLAHVEKTFGEPIIAVLGGTHLVEADKAYLQHVADVLRDQYGTPRLYLNHCTGNLAYLVMVEMFGDRVNLCPAGTTVSFD